MIEALDPDSDDLSAMPWDYPGTAARHGGLLHEGRYARLTPAPGRPVGEARLAAHASRSLDGALLGAGVVTTADRFLVVAVGSNASPAVMHRKLDRAGVSTTVPFVGGTVENMGVGHTARVSTRGYLAAAPVFLPGRRTRVFASLLDEDQLACIDATEPGYVRRQVDSGRCSLTLESGERPPAFLVYVATAGVIASPDSAPLALGRQEDVFESLRRDCRELGALIGTEPHYREVMGRLAAEADLRDAVGSCLQDIGWTVASGLEDCPESDALPYGELERGWAA